MKYINVNTSLTGKRITTHCQEVLSIAFHCSGLQCTEEGFVRSKWLKGGFCPTIWFWYVQHNSRKKPLEGSATSILKSVAPFDMFPEKHHFTFFQHH